MAPRTWRTQAPVALAIVLALAFLAQAGSASRKHSLTWDEPSFIGGGYAFLTEGDFRFNPSHPPLMQELEAAPLMGLGLPRPTRAYAAYEAMGNAVFYYGRDLVYGGGLAAASIAFRARLPVLLLGAALALMVFFWGRRVYGPWGALAAATLAAFCPNLIAHAGLATEDLGCAALMFAAVWTLWLAKRDGGTWRWARCGAVTGLALVTKYTAILLLPSYALIAVVCVMQESTASEVKTWARGAVIIGIVAAVTMAIPYGFQNGWATYMAGLSSIYRDLRVNPTFYLAGNFSPVPRWYYTMAALFLKTALPALILICAGASMSLLDKRVRRDAWFILIPAAVVIGVSMFDEANIGLRRILPALPFLYLAAGGVMHLALGKFPRTSMAAVAALLLWTSAETAAVYPDHLSYFSAVIGGPGAGHRWLDDSNIDWGQDLPALAKWQREHPDSAPLNLSYFGSAIPEAYGVRSVPVTQIDPAVDPAPGLYAMSVHNLLRQREASATMGARLDWLARYQPIARAGRSIYIYRLR